jgi:hypothetical protein
MVGVQAGQERSKNGWSDTCWFVCILLASHIWSAEGLDGDELSMHGWHLARFSLMPCEPRTSKFTFQIDMGVISLIILLFREIRVTGSLGSVLHALSSKLCNMR